MTDSPRTFTHAQSLRMYEALTTISEFDPEDEYNQPVDEWAQARAFSDCQDLARAALRTEEPNG